MFGKQHGPSGSRVRRIGVVVALSAAAMSAGTTALADQPIDDSREVRVAVVNESCGFPVEIALDAVDEYTVFYRDDELVRFRWQVIGFTAVFLTFSAQGDLIEYRKEVHGRDNPEVMPPELCRALA